ncbi:unnamed protein product, partial [Tilletia caries]|jgi:hypothetical protein
MHTS